jgi:hypothetical protein
MMDWEPNVFIVTQAEQAYTTWVGYYFFFLSDGTD